MILYEFAQKGASQIQGKEGMDGTDGDGGGFDARRFSRGWEARCWICSNCRLRLWLGPTV